MRDDWEAARAAGVNLAFMGGNISYWQARFGTAGDGTADRRTLVEYRNGGIDPEPVNSLKTDRLTSSYINRPECQLLGVGYAGAANPADRPRSYYVPSSALANPWFDGTGLAAGDTLTDTVGYEWDHVVPCEVPTPAEVLEFGGLTTGNPGSYPTGADAVTYTASSGARVFSSSSMQVNWALDDFGHPPHVNPHAQVLFANIFNDLGAIPVPVLQAPASGAAAGMPVELSWTTSMGMARYQVSLDGNVVATLGAASCSAVTCSVQVPASPGPHTWNVAGTDLLGATVTGQSQRFTVSSSRSSAYPPHRPGSVLLVSPSSGAVLWNPASRLTWRRWSGAAGATRYQVRIDRRVVATTTATSYRPRTPLADGRHSWSVVAITRTARKASATFVFDVRSVRAMSQSRRSLLAHGLSLEIYCPGRCSVSVRVRGGGLSFSGAARLRGGIAVKTLTLRLSQLVRRDLQAVPAALLYVRVRTRFARRVRTVTFVVRWSRSGLVGGV
jgi:hypothetical protein